jgi:FtsX extracellular domain
MMQIDELRGELTTLADEIEPLRGDLGALHRRQRRRRIASSLVVALAVVVAVSTIVVVRHRDNGKVRVTGAGSKEVPSAQINHVDVIVVPATPAVQDVLDASPVVRRYARVTRAVRGSSTSLGAASSLLAPFCALERSDGFAVQAMTGGSDIQQVLARDLAGRATSYDVSYALGYDLRLFLKIGASSAQVESVRAALASNPDISWMRFVSPAQAYEDFKKLFADQPALVQGTKPSDLPASFTIDLEPGASVPTATQRYKQLGSVDSAIAGPSLFTPTFLFSPTNSTASACAKP